MVGIRFVDLYPCLIDSAPATIDEKPVHYRHSGHVRVPVGEEYRSSAAEVLRYTAIISSIHSIELGSMINEYKIPASWAIDGAVSSIDRMMYCRPSH